MVTLAQKFEQERKIPAEPYAEKTEAKTHLPKTKKTKSVPSSTTPAPKTTPIMPTLPLLQSPSTPGAHGVTLAEDAASLIAVASDYPPLPLPMTFGSYKKFNYTSRKKVERVCVRILCHSAVELQDIEYTWVTPSILKLTIYWPEWFTFAEQMAMFVVRDDGEPEYPPDHPLTESFAENNAKICGEDKRIKDEGYILFEKDMKEDSFQIERVTVAIPSKQTEVRGIQIFAE